MSKTKVKKVTLPEKKERLQIRAERFQRVINGFYQSDFLKYGDRDSLIDAIYEERLAISRGFNVIGEVRKGLLKRVVVSVPKDKSKQVVRDTIEMRFRHLVTCTVGMDLIPLDKVEKYEKGDINIFAEEKEKLFNETRYCYDIKRGIFGRIAAMYYDEALGETMFEVRYDTYKNGHYNEGKFTVINKPEYCVTFNNLDHVEIYAKRLPSNKKDNLLQIIEWWKLNSNKIN